MSEAINTKDLGRALKAIGLVSTADEGVEVVRIVLGTILEFVSKGRSVRIRGFGTFQPRVRKGGKRVLRGQETWVEDRKVVTFRSSNAVKRFLNEEDANPMYAATKSLEVVEEEEE